MGTPQILLLCLYSFSLLMAANKHGKPKEGTYEFQYNFIGFILVMTLLIYGGFFD